MFLIFFTMLYTVLSTYMLIFYTHITTSTSISESQLYHAHRLSSSILTKCFFALDKLIYDSADLKQYPGNEYLAKWLLTNLYTQAIFEDDTFRCIRFKDLRELESYISEMARGYENRIYIVHYKGEVKKRVLGEELEHTTNPLDPWFVFIVSKKHEALLLRKGIVKVAYCQACDDIDIFIYDKQDILRPGCEMDVNRYKLFYHKPYTDNNICGERDQYGSIYTSEQQYTDMLSLQAKKLTWQS